MKFVKLLEYILILLIRTGVSMVGIYFLNEAFIMKGYEIAVALNQWTALVCAFLGFPGVVLLYGIQFFLT